MSERIERRVVRIEVSEAEMCMVLDDGSVLIGLTDVGIDQYLKVFPSWSAKGVFKVPGFRIERVP